VARKLRVEYPGAVHHVMNRGDRCEPIARDDKDRQRFFTTLGGGLCQDRLAGACALPDVQSLSSGNGNAAGEPGGGDEVVSGHRHGAVQSAAQAFRALFSERYRALVVDVSGNEYLRTVCDYVNLNLARPKLLKPEQRLQEYAWSSWPEYLKRPGKRWTSTRKAEGK